MLRVLVLLLFSIHPLGTVAWSHKTPSGLRRVGGRSSLKVVPGDKESTSEIEFSASSLRFYKMWSLWAA